MRCTIPIARSRRWPRDLFELAGVGAVTLPGAVKTPTYSYKPSDQSRQTWAVAAVGSSSSRPSSGGCGTSRCSIRSGSGPIRSPGARTSRPGRGGCGSTPWSKTGAFLIHWT